MTAKYTYGKAVKGSLKLEVFQSASGFTTFSSGPVLMEGVEGVVDMDVPGMPMPLPGMPKVAGASSVLPGGTSSMAKLGTHILPLLPRLCLPP